MQDSLTAAQQAAVAQQLVARMTPEQQAVVAQLGEKEQVGLDLALPCRSDASSCVRAPVQGRPANSKEKGEWPGCVSIPLPPPPPPALQLRVLTNFYERLFIPPHPQPWQPGGTPLPAVLPQRREPQPPVSGTLAGGSNVVGIKPAQLQQLPLPSTPRFQQQAAQQKLTPLLALPCTTSRAGSMLRPAGCEAAGAAAAGAGSKPVRLGSLMLPPQFGSKESGKLQVNGCCSGVGCKGGPCYLCNRPIGMPCAFINLGHCA